MVWRYWAASWLLIVAGLAGWEPGFYAATALALVQIVHFRVTEGGFMDFAVQVRIAVFLIFLAALWFRPLFWLPPFGLFARITVNYCLTARTLALMP